MSELDQQYIQEVQEIFHIKDIGNCKFHSENDWNTGFYNMYGGQLIAQSLAAAALTVKPDFILHSMHSQFLKAGENEVPLCYEVDCIKDGRGFSSRYVKAIQNSDTIFTLSCSFVKSSNNSAGFFHQVKMPEVYPPDDPINTFTPNNQPPRNMNIGVLPVDGEGMMMGDVFTTLHLAVPKDEKLRKEIEQLGINRNVKKNQELNKLTKKDIMRPYNLRWCKISKDLKSSYPMCRLIMLAFMSDLRFLAINAQPHYLGYNYGKTDHVMMTSLDHTMYFYTSDFEIEDSWLLYETESLRYANGRGVTHGRFFDTKGKMIASTLQEALVILLYTPKSGTNGSQVPDKETLASTTLTFSKPPPMLYVEKSGVERASSSAVSLVSTKL